MIVDWFALLVTIIGGYYCTKLLQKWLKWKRILKRLEVLPTPPALPIIGHSLSFVINGEVMIPLSTSLHEKYGPVFFTWIFMSAFCSFSKAGHVEAVLSNSEAITKSFVYKFLEPWLGTGLLTGTGPKWFSHRKLLTPSFHFAILETFIDTFNEKSKIFERKLRRISPGSEFNMYPLITLCTLDIICEAVMGIDMKTQEDDLEINAKSKYISGIYSITELTTLRFFRPWVHKDWFYYLTSEGKKYTEGLKKVHNFTNKVVLDKRASRKLTKEQKLENTDNDLGIKKKKAFLDLLLEASEKGETLTDEEVREQVDTFMFEGHDTTTAGICWAVFLLGNYPEIQDKVFQELDGIFQGRQRTMTSADLKEMKYLERVIKETLRLYPSVPFIERKLTRDLDIGDYVIPGTVNVRIAIYNLHRSPEYFENPNEFNPDNFLPEKVKNRHPFAYIPFSAGPRNCIGQKFAMMELKAVLATIFLNFRVESVEKVKDIIPLVSLIVKPKNGLKVRLYPRTKNT